MVSADAAARRAARAAFAEGLATVEREPSACGRRWRRSACSTSCAGAIFFSRIRATTTAAAGAVRGPRARAARKRGRPEWLRPLSPACSRRVAGQGRLRLDVLSRRHRRPLFRALDRRSSPRRLRSVRVSPAARYRSACAAARRACRSFPALPGVAPFAARAAHSRRRARCARVSGARHGHGSVRAGRAAARAAAMRGLGTSGDHAGSRRSTCSSPARRWSRPMAPRTTPRRLVTLPGIGTRYAMPEVPARRDARALRTCRPRGPLLLCPQSLFKIHPDNDALFARVLRERAGGAARAVRRTRSAADRAVPAPARGGRYRARDRVRCCRNARTTTTCASMRCAT